MKEIILTHTLNRHLAGKKKRLSDDWCWTGFALFVSCVAFYANWKYDVNLTEGASSIATGMFALMSIGASSILASAPRFLVIDLKEVPNERIKENLRSFIAIQWVNLRVLMLAAMTTLAVALINSAIGDVDHINKYQGYISSILPGLVFIAFRRWWLLTKELVTMVLLYIDDRFPDEEAK